MISFNIPLSLVGSILNVLALYCVWRNKRQSCLSNSDKLFLVLNVADSVYCMIILPVKVISYLLNPTMTVKPRYHGYLDALSFCFTSLTVILIAFNRFVKISKASRHHVILPSVRLHKLLLTALTVSLLLPMTIFFNLQVAAKLNAVMLIGTNILLWIFYALITRTQKQSRRRTLNNNRFGGNRNQEIVSKMAELRLSRNVLVIISAYFFCCACLLAMLINHVVKPTQRNHDLIKVGVWFMSLNSLINPIFTHWATLPIEG